MKKEKADRSRMMLEEPISSVIPKMAIPTIVAFLINSIYSLADTYFVSSIGIEATAAVSVNASLDQLIMMAGSLLAVGAASYIARLLGQGNKDEASSVLSTAFFIAAFFGLTLAVFGSIFILPLVRLLGATPTCEQHSVEYATYVLLAAPFMASSFVMNQCLRSEGSATLSMVGMGFGGILNCILDPIFIMGLNLGVAGASMATAISKVVSFAILIYPYLTKKSVLRLSIRRFNMKAKTMYEIISVGSSSMFRSLLAVVSAILLNKLAGEISDSVLAGIGVTNKIMMFPFGIILGFGTGFQPVAGFNFGAKRYDRVMESYRFATKVIVAMSVIMAALVAIFVNPIIRAFAGTDPQMIQIGRLCILLQCAALPIHGWGVVINMLCAGLGRAGSALVLSTSRQGTCFLPILYPMAWAFGAFGLAGVQAAADVLTLVLAVPILRRTLRYIRETAEKEHCTI